MDAAVRRSVQPLVLADIILIILVSLATFLYTRHFVSELLQIHAFLKEVSTGNLNARMPRGVLRRRDEIGETAQCALTMQHSLHTLVERDSLTKLFNRGYGDKKLRQAITDSRARRLPFCIALGDIDFFKKVNDTYGHECGDIVLQHVAQKLKQHMRGKGFAARWGGEEFLFVFENTELDAAWEVLETVRQEIQDSLVSYNDQTIRVSMTFGVVSGDPQDVTALLRSADEKLYVGKTSGRNRVIK